MKAEYDKVKQNAKLTPRQRSASIANIENKWSAISSKYNAEVQEIKNKDVDYIVGPEARGLIIGSAVANELKIGFIPVRKAGKLPPETVEKQFEYEKEYGKDKLELPKLVNEEYKNKKFYIIDDIYATGNTMKAIINAIQEIGGIIKGQGVIMNIKELNNDKVFSLLDVNET